MMTNKQKDERLNLRISSEDKRLLEKDAQKEERTVSNLLIWLWKNWRAEKKKG
ncbi:MAG: hypothetical protein HQL29_01915 [Candidatus Omnitrophica bacterium]|nr:hypothetical protein [Candidatus Omnitrophota bacterium]